MSAFSYFCCWFSFLCFWVLLDALSCFFWFIVLLMTHQFLCYWWYFSCTLSSIHVPHFSHFTSVLFFYSCLTSPYITAPVVLPSSRSIYPPPFLLYSLTYLTFFIAISNSHSSRGSPKCSTMCVGVSFCNFFLLILSTLSLISFGRFSYAPQSSSQTVSLGFLLFSLIFVCLFFPSLAYFYLSSASCFFLAVLAHRYFAIHSESEV